MDREERNKRFYAALREEDGIVTEADITRECMFEMKEKLTENADAVADASWMKSYVLEGQREGKWKKKETLRKPISDDQLEWTLYRQEFWENNQEFYQDLHRAEGGASRVSEDDRRDWEPEDFDRRTQASEQDQGHTYDYANYNAYGWRRAKGGHGTAEGIYRGSPSLDVQRMREHMEVHRALGHVVSGDDSPTVSAIRHGNLIVGWSIKQEKENA